MASEQLVDSFGRQITYLRMSVTDRCDFRCVYCMSENMTFLPREQVLSLEEIHTIAKAFTELGISKIRFTGGEPLVRRDVIKLFKGVGALPGLKDFCLTTNGSQLPRYAQQLKDAGLTRINISLDSLQEARFKALTRIGDLHQVIAGIDAACGVGFKGVKLNAVVLQGRNDDEVVDLVKFARDKQIDLSFIEEMPLGVIAEHDRAETYFSSEQVKELITEEFPLMPTTENSGGPAKYWRMGDSDSRIGFISPHSNNFCGDCNRVRVTAEGLLLLCLGNEHSLDLKAILRRYPGDTERLKEAIRNAIAHKPEEHRFTSDGDVQIVRFMNMTGG
ncbi:GTP 3',8-cyclase MoaA [Neptunomonas japonica]|uniref:GTP 3',8-cyclase n=1 Tax=Neptunomonas japonica JAMM 1380 TaxID=1441457 RepID=A0A7R6PP02_9GAMM|nr:GTP 3',8-cyclase MoaA [Neptunomonas japonica]BBB29982.1 molybdenum cofactor biosynthesis protein [Neptunomonas japonica JAMM 1380]